MKKMSKFFRNNASKIFVLGIAVMMMATPVMAQASAAPGKAADPAGIDGFKNIMEIMATWTRWLGAGIAFFGAIQLAFGFRSDDAEGKNKGMRSMIAGFIVIAVGAMLDTFWGFI